MTPYPNDTAARSRISKLKYACAFSRKIKYTPRSVILVPPNFDRYPDTLDELQKAITCMTPNPHLEE
jgi:hypothetical protein